MNRLSKRTCSQGGTITTTNPLRDLERCDQSVWLDSISRDLIRSGTFARLIADDGVTGVTANPSIFEKAIVGTHDYDDDIRALAAAGCRPIQIYEDLVINDVGTAADMLRPVYDRRGGCDGFASIEVSPELAGDTAASNDEALRFWRELHRPNVTVKIPGTAEGLPAIEQLTADGINVNITLIFAVEVYHRVVDAYLSGLERRVQQGKPIDQIASVASFFVSRVDTLVARLLDEHVQTADDARPQEQEALKGTIAVANARIAYEHFRRVIESDRFRRLRDRGGQIQRPLRASTSTKNPAYPDTPYASSLIGPHTVNTMPQDTIDAFRDHGVVDCQAMTQALPDAHQRIREPEQAGISMTAVTTVLIQEGVDTFCQALHTLLDTIEQRQGHLVAS